MEKSHYFEGGIKKMGYYSTIELPRIAKDKIAKFNRQFSKRVKEAEKKAKFEWGLEVLKADKDGDVTENISDFTGKWYETDWIAWAFSPFVESGSEMVFIGEDGEHWGYWFDASGTVFHIKFERTRTTDKVEFVEAK